MTRATAKARFLAVMLASSAAACGSDDIAGTATQEGPDESLGRPLTGSGEVLEHSPIFWSADGTEVYFKARGPHDILRAVRVADGVIHDVSFSPTPAEEFAVSKDGRWIYRTRWPSIPWTDGEGLILERIPTAGGPANFLSSNVLHWGEHFASAMVPFSPDETLLAYATLGDDADPLDATVGTRDTIHVLDLASGERTTLGFGRPLAFSPDGDRLLYETRPCDIDGSSFKCRLQVLNLTTGRQEPAPPRTVRMTSGTEALWSESGIHLLGLSADVAFATRPETHMLWIVENLSRGTAEVVHELQYREEVAHLSRWKFCPGGARVAGWIEHFAARFEALHVADLGTDRRWVAVVNRSAAGWHSAFSPDCGRLAYAVGTRLYVRDL